MIRKQIYLTEELDRQIHLTAASEQKPEAQVIREVLHVGFLQKIPARTSGEALLGLAKLGEELGLKSDDPYLSRNIDKYLYEDE
jgi:hypothetical protein